MESKLKISAPAQQFFQDCDLSNVYAEKVCALLNPEGFNDLVQYLYQNSKKKDVDCYEEAEEIFDHFYGTRRYEDYNSYKSSYHQVKRRQRQKERKPERLPLFPEYFPFSE